MSIKILPQDDIKQAASSFQQPELLFANPKICIYAALSGYVN